MSALESVLSSVKTPAQFVNDEELFSIPSYQLPYVWSDEAIKSCNGQVKQDTCLGQFLMKITLKI